MQSSFCPVMYKYFNQIHLVSFTLQVNELNNKSGFDFIVAVTVRNITTNLN